MTNEKRTEECTKTHSCDCIERQAAIDAILAVTGNSSVRELYEHVQENGLSDMWSGGVNAAIDIIIAVPPAQPETHDKRTETHACDLISRQAALNALSRGSGCGASCHRAIKALPSAQAEIVRCRDCKHQVKEWRTGKRLKNKGYMVCGCEVVGDACGFGALLGQDDDYCSFAERRTDETDYRKE